MKSEIIDICSVSELPPGGMRLVEWEELEIGVFNCNGEIYAIEDRCSHDNGPLVEGVLAEQQSLARINADYAEKFGFHDAENYLYKAPKGLTREIVEKISEFKDEPEWMRDFRLKALEHFQARPMPNWGGNLSEIDFDNIYYYIRPTEKQANKWE